MVDDVAVAFVVEEALVELLISASADEEVGWLLCLFLLLWGLSAVDSAALILLLFDTTGLPVVVVVEVVLVVTLSRSLLVVVEFVAAIAAAAAVAFSLSSS